MDSFNYINLPWQQVENDDNDSDPNPALIGSTTVGLIICKSKSNSYYVIYPSHHHHFRIGSRPQIFHVGNL